GAAGAAATVTPAVSRGSTRPTNDSGTSHTPRLTRTGASSTTGVSFTRIWDQFRVNVTTWPGNLSRARMLVGRASNPARSRDSASGRAAGRASAKTSRPRPTHTASRTRRTRLNETAVVDPRPSAANVTT